MVADLHLENCTDRLWDRMRERGYSEDWMGSMLQIYLFRGVFQLCIPSN